MKKNIALFGMNIIYYFAFVVLIGALIIPHTSFFYSTSIQNSFLERVNTKTIYLVSGQRYRIKTFTLRKVGAYKSYDFKVADVTPLGLVIAKNPGTTVIRVKTSKETYKYRIHVMKLSKSKLYLEKGQMKKLNVKNKAGIVSWRSSNRLVATVNRLGVVKAKGTGSVFICAKVKGRTLKCKVIVR